MTLTSSMRVAWRSRDFSDDAARSGRARVPVAAAQSTGAIDPMRRASKALREWSDIFCEAFPGSVVDATERRFNGELWSCRIGEMKLAHIRAQRSRVARWLDGGQPESSDSVLLHLQAAGQCISHQRGHSTMVDPGDGIL